MSMEEAYNAACLGHPQIAKILSARNSQQLVQKKQKASSSIYGTSGGSMSGGSPNSVEAALNSAWDNAGRMQSVGVYSLYSSSYAKSCIGIHEQKAIQAALQLRGHSSGFSKCLVIQATG